MSDPTRSLRNIFAKITQATRDSIDRSVMLELGQFTVDLIVKRTRLGYGVPVMFGTKSKLKSLSQRYIDQRSRSRRLSDTTSPRKSNLTFTGQMLASVRVITAENGKIRFGPTGTRSDSRHTNAEIAGFQERQGRIFNRISQLEYQQVLREYRREFGDLLRKRRIIQ